MAYLPFPSGTLLTYAGSTAPDGWLLCDGSAISRTTYARLFAAISTTYGNGDGALTFNLPDLRGVYPRGAGTNGTANYGGVTGHTPAAGVLATKGGQKTAKNGLTNSGSNTVSGTAAAQTVSTSSVSGTTNIGHTHTGTTVTGTVGGTDGTHAHDLNNANLNEFIKWVDPNGDRALSLGTNVRGGLQSHGLSVTTTNSGHGHSYALTAGGQTIATTNVSLASGAISALSLNSSALTATAAAPTITGDTETTPAFLAVNYIIKL